MTDADWQAIWLTAQLAAVTTLALLLIGLPLALVIARLRGALRTLAEALIALPLVLPPTVIGFYLLLLFAPQSGLGHAWQQLTGQPLSFSFSGLVLASMLYSLPFTVQPLLQGLERIPRSALEAAATLGAGPVDRLLTVTLPALRSALLAAATLSFAHTVGEFGVVLMIGGNLPGETRVAAIALFEHVETLNYSAAHALSGWLVAFAFTTLLIGYGWLLPKPIEAARHG